MAVLLTVCLRTTSEVPALDSTGKTMTLADTRDHDAGAGFELGEVVLLGNLNRRNAVLAPVFKYAGHLQFCAGKLFSHKAVLELKKQKNWTRPDLEMSAGFLQADRKALLAYT